MAGDRESTQSVVIQEERIVIDGLRWVVVKFSCEVACETGTCPYSGPWAESEIDANTCALDVELEGPHGEVDRAHTYYGELAMDLLSEGEKAPRDLLEIAETRALEQHAQECGLD